MAKWHVDTKNDGADCTIEGDDLVDADDALTLVAEHARENDSATHPEGRAAWARERGWTATRVDPEEVTDEQIEALKSEARDAGDVEQATICERALLGDDVARAECVRVIRAAEAMAD